MIRGIVTAVPRTVAVNTDPAFIRMTGVEQRRIIQTGLIGNSTLGLAAAACNHLMNSMDIAPREIDTLIFVTQTPHIRMPATACVLAGHLGINAPAFDVNLACSGYVYGLWLANALGGRVLLVAGDTVSQMCDREDKGTYPLFGDAVSATLVDPDDRGMWPRFDLGTDGSGFRNLIADPIIRMDGPEVMNFALATVPPLVERTTLNSICDWYLFHQANGFILKHIAKKCGLPTDKVPLNISKYGNTSSASIPLLMCDSAATESLKSKRNRVSMFGFGAGWSWAAAMVELPPLSVCEVIEV